MAKRSYRSSGWILQYKVRKDAQDQLYNVSSDGVLMNTYAILQDEPLYFADFTLHLSGIGKHEVRKQYSLISGEGTMKEHKTVFCYWDSLHLVMLF